MEHPGNGHPPQPAHVDDFNEMPNDGSPFNDHGGVHYNSGIPNHAYYLMVEAIGRDAAKAIVYGALTEELGPDSGFEDSAPPRSRSPRACGARTARSTRARTSPSPPSGLDGTWEAPVVEGC
jgi:Zn-dependent metalloprotease